MPLSTQVQVPFSISVSGLRSAISISYLAFAFVDLHFAFCYNAIGKGVLGLYRTCQGAYAGCLLRASGTDHACLQVLQGDRSLGHASYFALRSGVSQLSSY